jgi:hypothetical protein
MKYLSKLFSFFCFCWNATIFILTLSITSFLVFVFESLNLCIYVNQGSVSLFCTRFCKSYRRHCIFSTLPLWHMTIGNK